MQTKVKDVQGYCLVLEDGIRYGISRKTGLSAKDFRVGEIVNVATWRSPEGKWYITGVKDKVSLGSTAAQIPTASSLPKEKVAGPSPADPKKEYVARDFQAEAVGKTKCAIIEASLMSPFLPVLATDVEGVKAFVKEMLETFVPVVFEKK